MIMDVGLSACYFNRYTPAGAATVDSSSLTPSIGGGGFFDAAGLTAIASAATVSTIAPIDFSIGEPLYVYLLIGPVALSTGTNITFSFRSASRSDFSGETVHWTNAAIVTATMVANYFCILGALPMGVKRFSRVREVSTGTYDALAGQTITVGLIPSSSLQLNAGGATVPLAP